jgi:hypothetical protein
MKDYIINEYTMLKLSITYKGIKAKDILNCLEKNKWFFRDCIHQSHSKYKASTALNVD